MTPTPEEVAYSKGVFAIVEAMRRMQPKMPLEARATRLVVDVITASMVAEGKPRIITARVNPPEIKAERLADIIAAAVCVIAQSAKDPDEQAVFAIRVIHQTIRTMGVDAVHPLHALYLDFFGEADATADNKN
jgi:hypothetical protein